MVAEAGRLASEGHYNKTICHALGIGVSTLTAWQRRAEAGEEPFAALIAAIETGTASAEISATRIIREAALDDWHAAAWFLERRHSEHWARKDKHTHAMAGRGTAEVILSWGPEGLAEAEESPAEDEG